MIGQRFGRWTVVAIGNRPPRMREAYWRCLCDCGTEKNLSSGNLKSGRTNSCGCLNKEIASQRMTRHGHARENHNGGKTITWRKWESMRERCIDPNSSSYKNYGGRGITVCAGWQSDFINFLQDMGECPARMTLDRIENNGGYWCGHCDECVSLGRTFNCRWATWQQQARNKTNTRHITFNGETLSTAEWAERFQISYPLFMSRLYLGWSVENALTIPKLSSKEVTRRARAARTWSCV